MRRGTRRRGSAALEMAILAPAAIILMLFAVYGGRVYLAQQMVDGAANAAARAASEATPTTAVKDATDMAMTMLANRGRTCMAPAVRVDMSQFHAHGQVIVYVTCTASVQDLTLLPLRGDRTLSSMGKSPIESHVGIAG